jgi:hypothetical protein
VPTIEHDVIAGLAQRAVVAAARAAAAGFCSRLPFALAHSTLFHGTDAVGNASPKKPAVAALCAK